MREVEAKKNTRVVFRMNCCLFVSFLWKFVKLRNHESPLKHAWSLFYASMGPYGALHAPKTHLMVSVGIPCGPIFGIASSIVTSSMFQTQLSML